MKKSLIALAVAGAMTAPMVAQADATLYGKFEALMQFNEDEDVALGMDDVQFGIKGSNATDIDGLTAIYQLEVELNEGDMGDGENAEITTRKAWAGVKGDFGAVLAGRQGNPVEAIEGYTDLGNKTKNTAFGDNPDRLGSALAYATPDMGGFSAAVGMVFDGTGDDTNPDTDGYALNAQYSVSGLTFGVGYWSFDNDATAKADQDWTAVGVSYEMDALYVALTYQNNDQGSTADYDEIGLAASYSFGSATVYGIYYDYDEDVSDDDADEFSVGLEYALGGKAKVGVEYVAYEDFGTDDTQNNFNVSYTVKF